jgi:hypothetical protein
MEHPLIIKIDRYDFQLLYKMIEKKKYIKIKIRNLTLKIDFIVYSSNSHGNIYRFCSLTDSTKDSQLFKGRYDYVTETFVHMELQKFINENLSKLIEKPIETCPLKTDNLYPDRPLISYENYLDERFINFDIIDPFLNIISKLECGRGFKHIYRIIQNILDIYDIYGYLHSKSISNVFDKLVKDILLFFDKGKTGINIKDYLELMGISKELEKTRTSGLTSNNKHKLTKLYLEFISFYMNINYEIKFDTKTLLYDTGEFTMKKDPSIKLNFYFHSVVIQNKDNKLEYTIIYAIYKYENKLIPKYNGLHSIMLNMIPHQDNGNKINSLGLYKKFSKIGIYICKPFDYSEQVETLVRGSSPTEYYFIGDLYDSLFPVKQLLDHKKQF